MTKKLGDTNKSLVNSSKRGTAKGSPAKSSKISKGRSDQVLGDIHKKITSSSALNGGFDVLMFKIEKIEQNQEQIVNKVDKIHEAIYDPADGIFSKMSASNVETIEKINETDQRIIEITEWKKRKEKDEDKIEESVETSSEIIRSLQNSVDDLQKSKNTAWSILRWILVAFSGGSLTIFFKWLENKL